MAQIICLRLVFQYADIYRDNNKIVNFPRRRLFYVPILDNDKNNFTV